MLWGNIGTAVPPPIPPISATIGSTFVATTFGALAAPATTTIGGVGAVAFVPSPRLFAPLFSRALAAFPASSSSLSGGAGCAGWGTTVPPPVSHSSAFVFGCSQQHHHYHPSTRRASSALHSTATHNWSIFGGGEVTEGGRRTTRTKRRRTRICENKGDEKISAVFTRSGSASSSRNSNSYSHNSRSQSGVFSSRVSNAGGPLHAATLGSAAAAPGVGQEALFVSDMASEVMAATSVEKTAAEKKADFPLVTMDADATQKFAEIVVRWDSKSEEDCVLIRGLAAAEYHVQAGEPTMEQLEAAGVEARITGGGRIKHDSATKTIFIFGYSMQFGPADLVRVAAMCRVAYPDYDVSFNKGGY